VDSGKGFQFTGGSGGHGLDPRTTDVRIMDPVTGGKYEYPNGYVSYSNGSGQAVNSYTGQIRRSARPTTVVALALLMKIEDLFTDADRRRLTAQPEMDPLTEASALQEAQLLDVRVHALSSTVGLLFDLRTALQFMEGNTALLIARLPVEFGSSVGS
jgi:hypothetical protein